MSLEHIEIFKKFDDEQMGYIRSISVAKKFKKDNILFYEGDMPKYLHIVTKGSVKVYKIKDDTQDLKEVTVGHFKRGDMVAELANFENIPYPATAVFKSDGEILLIDFETFKSFLDANSNLYMEIIKSLTKKIKTLEKFISNNINISLKNRLIKFLIENENELKNITQKNIADTLSAAPESINRNIKILKKESLIATNKGKIEIVNKEALLEIIHKNFV